MRELIITNSFIFKIKHLTFLLIFKENKTFLTKERGFVMLRARIKEQKARKWQSGNAFVFYVRSAA